MTRPRSIILFERFYLSAWAISLVTTLIDWSAIRYERNAVELARQAGEWFVPTFIAICFAVPLLLWYLIARRGSVVAKWIVIVFTALWVAWTGMAVAGGGLAFDRASLTTLLSLALTLLAAYQLLRPDARAWFGNRVGVAA